MGLSRRRLRRRVRPAARRARRSSRGRGVEHFALDRLLVRVVEDPGHKDGRHRRRASGCASRSSPSRRSTRPRSALDPFARTVDSLEALGLDDPVFLVGADEFAAFLDVEGSRARARARTARRGDAARVSSATGWRPCWRELERPDRVVALRDRAASPSPPPTIRAARRPASRSTASCPPRSPPRSPVWRSIADVDRSAAGVCFGSDEACDESSQALTERTHPT